MRDAEKYEIKPLFVVVQFGEVHSWTSSEQSALKSARECVEQQIVDHWRHKLPVKVTEDIARDLDVRLYRLDSRSELTLPIQQWFDENYKQRQESARDDEEREYRRFLELRAKHEERFQREASRPSGLINCS
jgi:hypothetical protein